MEWPKKHISWVVDRIIHISIPFTWELPVVRRQLMQMSIEWDLAVVGGPAVKLMPNYFDDLDFVSTHNSYPGVLQKINPRATRTTIGCIRDCGFCGVQKIEGKFKELDNWPDLPVICDNNLLAASHGHFDKVIDRLIKWGYADFNQGLDTRLLSDYHAMRFAEIKEPRIYLSLDNIAYIDSWGCAYDRLRSAGIAKRMIRSYAIIGFNTDPHEAWKRCEWIESHGVKVNPQWYHPLDALERNIVTQDQLELGWSNQDRLDIMGWYYRHRKPSKNWV